MSGRNAGELLESTRAAAQMLVQGVTELLRVQLSVASGDVDKAAAVTETVAADFDCMQRDVKAINSYCEACLAAVHGPSGGPGAGGGAGAKEGEGGQEGEGLKAVFEEIDLCHEEVLSLEEAMGRLEGYMASLESRWDKIKNYNQEPAPYGLEI